VIAMSGDESEEVLTTGQPDKSIEYLNQLSGGSETLGSMEHRLIRSSVLQNWVNERTALPDGASIIQTKKEEYTTQVGSERRARKMITAAIERDIYSQDHLLLPRLGYDTVFPDLMETKADIITQSVQSELLSWNIAGRLSELKVVNPDTVTGENIVTEVVLERGKMGVTWIARQINANGELIAEAKLGQGNVFHTELTLNYPGERFEGEGKNANPKILNNRRLERGAATTFALLAKHAINSALEKQVKESKK